MRLLQAAMRDRAAKGWREKQLYYRVGSVFKGCAYCGDYELDETESGGERRRYTSGLQVFRSYNPKWMGWTWYCWECGAKDLQCWEPDELGMIEAQLGKPPVQGTFEAKRNAKYALRKELMKLDTRAKVPSRSDEIARLEAQLAELRQMLTKGAVNV